MNDIWTTAGFWLVRTILGSGFLLLLTCFLMYFTRQPTRRQRLGECGVLAALLVALSSAVQPSWLVIAWDRTEFTPSYTPRIDDLVLADQVPTEPADGQQSPVQGMERPIAAPMLPPRVQTTNWLAQAASILAAGFATLAGFFTLRLFLGQIALTRLLRRSHSAPSEVLGLFDAMAAGTRWARLLVTQRLLVPLSFGLWRPTVLLPAPMCNQPAPQHLRWVFAHELTHLRRRDAWSTLLLNLGQIFFFALPWYWWLRRQVRLCQEFVADAAAVNQGEEGVEYAEFLLSLANAPAIPVGASAVSGKRSDLSRRVAMLLNDRVRVETGCPKKWTAPVAAGLIALAVLVSGVGYQAEAAADDQVVIVIRPSGSAGQDKEKKAIFLLLKKTDGEGAGQEKDLITWERAVAGEIEFQLRHNFDQVLIEKAEVWLPTQVKELVVDVKNLVVDRPDVDFQTELRLLTIDPEQLQLRVPDKVRRFTWGSESKKLSRKFNVELSWVLQPRDDLAPLREALKKLEKLKSEGKLTSDTIQSEVLKALKEMKAEQVRTWVVDRPIVIEKTRASQKEAKANTGPQVVVSIADLQILLKELERLQSAQALGDWEKAREERMKLESKALKYLEERRKVRGVFGSQKKVPIGISVEPLSPALAEQLKLPSNVGLLVKDVVADNPWAKAGVIANDVLAKIAGAMVPGNLDDFHKFVESLKTETPLEVIVIRKGTMQKAGSLTLPGADKAEGKQSHYQQALDMYKESLKRRIVDIEIPDAILRIGDLDIKKEPSPGTVEVQPAALPGENAVNPWPIIPGENPPPAATVQQGGKR